MALDSDTMQKSLEDAFKEMKDHGKDDVYFSEEVAKAFQSFGESGDIKTVDTGTVSAGVFAGTGEGSLTLTYTLMSNPIMTACELMKFSNLPTNAMLASAIATGLTAMTLAGTVETKVNGSITPSSGSPIPVVNEKATGKIACVIGTFEADLTSFFDNMKDDYNNYVDSMNKYEKDIEKYSNGELDEEPTKPEDYDGDKNIAKKLVELATTYFKSGIVTTSGTGAIAGSVGSGSIDPAE